MSKEQSKRRRRKKAVATAYAKANAEPIPKLVRLRTQLVGHKVHATMTQAKATEFRKVRRALMWQRRHLEKANQEKAEKSAPDDGSQEPTTVN